MLTLVGVAAVTNDLVLVFELLSARRLALGGDALRGAWRVALVGARTELLSERPTLFAGQECELARQPRHHGARTLRGAAIAQRPALVDGDRIELLLERRTQATRCPGSGRVSHLRSEE